MQVIEDYDVVVAGSGAGGLKDSATDQPASVANTLTYTLNVTQCLAAKGLNWDPGHEMEFQFQATTKLDQAEQVIDFKRQ